MEPWRASWCFYNSIAFSSVTAVALLGTFAVVIPALFALPSKLEPKLGELHTDYIRLKEARNWTIFWGIVTIIFSFLVIIPYWKILVQTNGETCNVTVVPGAEIYYYLDALYFFTFLVPIFLGSFYVSLQNAKKRYEALEKKNE